MPADVSDLLACPACRAALDAGSAGLSCIGCGARYPVEDGILRLAVHGGSETWGTPQAALQSADYQHEFQEFERAAAYNRQFRRYPLKLGVTARESALIRRHIARVGRSRVILDLPSGGARLTPAFAPAADLVIEADIAIGQLRYGRANSKVETPRAWMTASAFHIPLKDESVDGVVCVRLLHHLPTAAERERLFSELLRVARRFVIVTFFDRRSLKHVTWRWRHPFSRKERKPALGVEDVAALAAAHGARLVDAPALSRIGSGHRYALLLKDRAAG